MAAPLFIAQGLKFFEQGPIEMVIAAHDPLGVDGAVFVGAIGLRAHGPGGVLPLFVKLRRDLPA